MAHVQSHTQGDDDVDASVLARLELDAAAALDFLGAHADDFDGGEEVAVCLGRRRVRVGATRRVG